MTIRGPFAFFIVALLIVSLAANFLVLGFAAARYGGFPGYGNGGAIERIVALGVRAFPRDMRREIGDRIDRHRGELHAALRDVRNARRHMFEVMSAQPFDRAALDAAFADVRAKTAILQRLGQELIGDSVEQASPEARARIRPPRHLW